MAIIKNIGIASAFVISGALVACGGAEGAAGQQGPAGQPGPAGPKGQAGQDAQSDAGAEPSISAVTPSSVFLGRTLDVSLSGFETKWTAAATVNFGEGIKVNSVKVASGTGLVANVTIDAGLAVGSRDVTVTEGASSSTFKAAFEIRSPIKVTGTAGDLVQGGVALVRVQNLDFANPFDNGQVSGRFTNMALGIASGATTQPSDVQPYQATFLVNFDVTAKTGESLIVAASGQTLFPLPGGVSLAARAAKPLTAGTALEGTVTTPLASDTYSFTPDVTLQIVDVVLTVSGAPTSASPALAFLPKSGKSEDRLSRGRAGIFATHAAEPIYAVFSDVTGAKGYGYSVVARSAAATGLAEIAGENGAVETAQAVTSLPAVVTGGSLAGGTDKDFFKVTIAAGDVGKKLRVLTQGGDARTDTTVQILNADGSAFAAEADVGLHENVLSAAFTVTGEYYVVIGASADFDTAANKYEAIVRLE